MDTGILSPGLKCGRGVTLTTHPYLMPRSRMSRCYTSSPLPPSASVACTETTVCCRSVYMRSRSVVNSSILVLWYEKHMLSQAFRGTTPELSFLLIFCVLCRSWRSILLSAHHLFIARVQNNLTFWQALMSEYWALTNWHIFELCQRNVINNKWTLISATPAL
jgi:hypothetical protein